MVIAAGKKIGSALFLLLLAGALLSSGCTQAITTYYISADGDDSNNGTSPATPWKSITHLAPGTTYLLKKGDTFYFNIPAVENPAEKDKITIASYGEGAKPVLNLYKRVNARGWLKHAENIWKVDLTNANHYTGFAGRGLTIGFIKNALNRITGVTPIDTNIGFIKVDGLIYGNKLTKVKLLAAPWDFFSDEKYLYVYSPRNPALGNPVIELSCNINAIDASDNMRIADIALIGSGAHGIWADNKKNVTIENVDITEIGGSFLPGYEDGTTRYGNGIEFWNGSNNCLVRNCKVSQVYDVAFTLQGTDANTYFAATTFQDNEADRNEQSFEAWVRGGGPGFSNCKFINNHCSNAGYGWSHAVRPEDNQHTAVHLLLFDWEVRDKDLLVEGNTFYRAKSGLYYSSEDDIPAFESRNNKIYLDPTVPIRATVTAYKIENAAKFVAATGKEAGSSFQLAVPAKLPVTVKSSGDEKASGH